MQPNYLALHLPYHNTTQHHNPEDYGLNLNHHENFKSHFSYLALISIKVKGKGKVVPVLPLTQHHAKKVYWEGENIAPPIP
jgi:hypothetical protein